MFSHSRLKVLTVVLALLIFVQPVVKANVLCDTLKSAALTACFKRGVTGDPPFDIGDLYNLGKQKAAYLP